MGRDLFDIEDEIIMTFCNIFGDIDFAMPMVRKQFERAGVDFRKPTSQGLKKVVENLVSVIQGMRGAEEARKARMKFNSILRQMGP